MELVDANTKNFLYLTLSQYNDQLNPVRCRVSMRRDQPFWGGGNSFIACESFRVSASPNPGGLYYKIIPHDWYIGATITAPVPLRIANNGPAIPAGFLAHNIPSTPAWSDPNGDHDPRYAEQHVRATEISATNIGTDAAPNYSELRLRLGVASLTNDIADPPVLYNDFYSSDPEIIKEHIGKFLNHYKISKGAWIKIRNEISAITPKKDWIGQIQTAPSIELRGGGFGPDGMDYQNFTITNIAACQNAIGGHAHVVEEDHTYRPPFVMDIQLTPNDPTLNTPTAIQLEEFWSNIGGSVQGFVKSVGQSPGPPGVDVAERNRWWPICDSTDFCRFFCPAGCTLRGPNAMFAGGTPNLNIANVANAMPKFPIYWKGPFEVGTEFSMTVPINYATGGPQQGMCVGIAPLVPGTTYHGLVHELSDSVVAAGATASMVTYMTDDAYTHIVDAKINLVGQSFSTKRDLCLNSELVISKGYRFGSMTDIYVNGVQISYEEHRPVAQSIGAELVIKTVATDNVYNPMFAGANSDDVTFVLSQTTDNVILRRPASENDFYCYTPNEFFYAFNKPLYANHSKEIDLPYAIQTDENGGFVIRWRSVDPANPSSELIVSVALVTALGLNPWFEYETEGPRSIVTKDMYYVKYPLTSDFRWIKRTDLSNHVPSQPFHPPNNPPNIGGNLWDRSGTLVHYIDHRHIDQNMYSSVTRRIYPDMETDEFDQDYYIWRDLPESGRITNTQQVSIESFATFSEITIVIPNLPFQPMLGTNTDERILASLRMPFEYSTGNEYNGQVEFTGFTYYGDLIFNTEPSRSYLKVTTDQQLYDCDCEVRLIERDGTMHVMELPYKGEFQIKLRMLQTQ